MPQTAATVFSWNLKINGKSVTEPFGGLRFSQAVEGYGVSGVSTGQFEFEIFDPYGAYADNFLFGSTAQLFEKNNRFSTSKIYYISKREVNKKICKFSAYDVMSKSDRDFDNTDFSDTEKTYSADYVMSAVKNQCGFLSVGYSDLAGLGEIIFTAEMLSSLTCRAVMEKIAEAMAGVWIADREGAKLCCFGTSFQNYSVADKYAEIDFKGTQKITGLIITDSDNGKITDLSEPENGAILTVETHFSKAAEAAWERVRKAVYTAWSCEKALIDSVSPDAAASGLIKFGESVLSANNVTIDVDSTGIYFSGGAEAMDEIAYKNRVERELNQRVKIGKTVGNTQIAPDGVKLVSEFVDKNAVRSAGTENTVVEKYGFNVGKNGFTEFEGDLVSAKVFDSAEKIDDNTIVITYPGNVRYKYTKEKNGNTVKFKKERLEAEKIE